MVVPSLDALGPWAEERAKIYLARWQCMDLDLGNLVSEWQVLEDAVIRLRDRVYIARSLRELQVLDICSSRMICWPLLLQLHSLEAAGGTSPEEGPSTQFPNHIMDFGTRNRKHGILCWTLPDLQAL